MPDSDPEDAPAAEVAAAARRRSLPTWARAVIVVTLLYFFLIAVRLLESGISALGEDTSQDLFELATHPLAALFVGVLATVLVQSSSVTTATIVGLVAGGVLTVDAAVPMIMGANIGTTVTNTIVSLASARQSEEFRRAFTAATMHDVFNIMAVAILLPLELATGILTKAATRLADLFVGGPGGGTFNSPIKGAVKAGAGAIEDIVAGIISNPTALGFVLILLGIIGIFVTLMFITKNMKVLVAQRIEHSLNAVLAKSGTAGMAAGTLITIAVQSSSITTSILIPLVGSGLLAVRNAYPITLGANVGTTITALLAALGAGTVDGLTIALVHTLFNVIAILLLYPIPKLRWIPVEIAVWMANLAVRRKWLAIAYVVGLFIVLPLVGILIIT